ncbi:YegP family protein [Nonomuraea sp. NBC_01738]|uniref:YegP family protein n=1 Tax=Nonomuraea sp. NBC_01738 TaxID=2976003 RepID=UPI002E117567|nr:YegP family protein [Nonomuraea sp. NBC_01738]
MIVKTGKSGENSMAGKFVIHKDKRGEFRFKLVAANGQTIAVSEGYSTKAACVNGVESVRKNAAEAAVDDQTLAAV